MDARFNIYSGPEKDIPAEDKARLEGFLKGREEADKLALLDEVKAAWEAKVAERD